MWIRSTRKRNSRKRNNRASWQPHAINERHPPVPASAGIRGTSARTAAVLEDEILWPVAKVLAEVPPDKPGDDGRNMAFDLDAYSNAASTGQSSSAERQRIEAIFQSPSILNRVMKFTPVTKTSPVCPFTPS